MLGHVIGRLLICALLHHPFALFCKFNLLADSVKANSVCTTGANLLNLVVNLYQFFLQLSLFFLHGLPILLWWKGLVEFGKSDRDRIEFLLNFCTLMFEVVKDGINVFLFEKFNKIIILLFAIRDVFDRNVTCQRLKECTLIIPSHTKEQIRTDAPRKWVFLEDSVNYVAEISGGSQFSINIVLEGVGAFITFPLVCQNSLERDFITIYQHNQLGRMLYLLDDVVIFIEGFDVELHAVGISTE